MIKNFLRTTANESCLLNACSLALIRDESHASCLRTCISIEFDLNAEYYSSHPYIEKFVKPSFALNKKNTFSQFLAFEALHSIYFEEQISSVDEDTENNVTSNTFPSFLCLLALYTSTRQSIECSF